LSLRLMEALDDLSGDVGRHGRATAMNVAQRGDQVRTLGLFEQVARSAGLKCLKNMIRILVNR